MLPLQRIEKRGESDKDENVEARGKIGRKRRRGGETLLEEQRYLRRDEEEVGCG